VRWTSALPPLTIGFRRAEIAAFWTVATAVLFLVLGLTAKTLGSTAALSWAASGIVVLFPGIVWRPWFEFGVRGWNKGMRWLTAAMRAYVLKVCYYVVFNAVGQTGSALDLAARENDVSRWIRRNEGSGEGFGFLHRTDGAGWGGEQSLLALARSPGRAWLVCLMPVVMLLMLLRDEAQDSSLPSSTYTLY
jgi:hypothetical protein